MKSRSYTRKLSVLLLLAIFFNTVLVPVFAAPHPAFLPPPPRTTETESEIAPIQSIDLYHKSEDRIRNIEHGLKDGVDTARGTIKNSFSPKGIARTVSVNLIWNLSYQVLNDSQFSIRDAFRSVFSIRTAAEVVAGTVSAAAGQIAAPMIASFIPVPIVANFVSSMLPTFAGWYGGGVGSSLASGMSFRESLKSVDIPAMMAGIAGFKAGSALGAMIPIPFLGPIIGGILGHWVAGNIFQRVSSIFHRNKDKRDEPGRIEPPPFIAYPGMMPYASGLADDEDSQLQNPFFNVPVPDDQSLVEEVLEMRIHSSIDRIPYDEMHPNLRRVKDIYEQAYLDYVNAINSGNRTLIAEKKQEFINQKERYERALSAYIK